MPSNSSLSAPRVVLKNARSLAPNRLMMLTRYPLPGRAKTRLIPHLGAEAAAQVQRQMAEHLLRQGLALKQQLSLTFEVHFTGGSLAQMRHWLGPEVVYQAQGPGDLGQRLIWTFEQGFATGGERLLAIGSDCPAITPAHLRTALEQLQQHDLVLGPALDGGYYLIGLRKPVPGLFEGIDWGTERVLEQTLAIASRLQLSTALLEPLPDIDRPEDLPVWEKIWGERQRAEGRR